MKRDRFTGEYDRVRKDAGYSRLHVKSEFPESTIDAHGRTVEDRVEEMRLDVHEQINLAREAEQEAERRAGVSTRHADRRAQIDRHILIDEYARRGLKPLSDQPCSLGLLLTIGWTIEQIGGQSFLVRPAWMKDPKEET